ncbi:tryptophan--tRNA ligase [Thermodesulfobacteriota bacterium]
MKKRVLSGIQPSGSLHIGNFFGMMKQMIAYQESSELFCFIANYHALTSVTDGKQLSRDTIEVALDFLALGLDPEKTVFWVQSDVKAVTELTWILSNVTAMGLLERCHSYKDKIAKGLHPVHGLFAYPVLMAADILLYKSNVIPVGKDQKQHVEVARDIAMRFNHLYGDTFILAEPEINENIAIIPGVDGQKMSKSYDNTIEIFCEDKALKKKVMGIVTDSKGVEEKKDPEESVPYNIYKLFASEELTKDLHDRYLAGGLGYGTVKKELLSLIMDYFSPYKKKRADLKNNLDYVYDVLKKGAEKASDYANETIEKVREKTGIKY